MRHLIVLLFASTLLLAACAGTKHGQVEDLIAVPQRGQSEDQRRADLNACVEKMSAPAPLLLGVPYMIYVAVERGHFKDCMKDRGYTLEDDPQYVGPRPK